MTKAQALAIQAQQVEYYSPVYPGGVDALRAAVAAITTADALDDGKEYAVSVISQHIPRGASIEALIREARGG